MPNITGGKNRGEMPDEKVKDPGAFVRVSGLGRLLPFFLLIFSVVWAGELISYMTSRKIVTPVRVMVADGKDSALPSARVYIRAAWTDAIAIARRDESRPAFWRVGGIAEVSEYYGKTAFIKNIYVAVAAQDVKNWKKAEVYFGEEKMCFPKEEIIARWKKVDKSAFRFYDNIGGFDNYAIYEAPGEVRLATSAIPLKRHFFSAIINWRGDKVIVLETMKGTALLSLLVLAVILVFYYLLAREKIPSQEDAAGLESEQKRFLTFVFTLFTSSLILVLVNAAIWFYYRSHAGSIPENYAETYLALVWPAFLPEPQERTGFLISVLIAPVLLICSYLFYSGYLARRRAATEPLYNATAAISVFIVASLVYLGLSMSDFLFIKNTYFYSKWGRYVFSLLIFPAIAGMLVFRGANGPIKAAVGKYLYPAGYALVFILLFFMNIFNYTAGYAGYHLNPVLYPLSEVLAGKFLLVDFHCLYGLFPLLISPIFRIFGLSVFKFSLLMSSLILVFYASLLLYMRKLVKNDFILWSGFLAVVFYTFLECPGIDTIYFQYWPVRTLFPGLSLLLAAEYYKAKSRTVYFASCALCAISAVWNLETGLAVAASWGLMLLVDEAGSHGVNKVFWKRALVHVAYGASMVFLAFLAVALYTRAGSGSWPAWGELTKYHKLFLSGYFGLPMAPPPHIWNVMVLIYLAGLLWPIMSFINGTMSWKDKAVLHLSLLGIALFNYYVSHSNDQTLFSPAYPAMVLAVIFLDTLLERIKQRVGSLYGEAAAFIILLYVISSAPFNFAYNARKYSGYIKSGLASTRPDNRSRHIGNIGFIGGLTEPGEAILILSMHNEGVYYAETRTHSVLDIPSSTDFFFKAEGDAIIGFLRNNQRAKVFAELPLETFDRVDAGIRKTIEREYRLISAGGSVAFYERVPGGSRERQAGPGPQALSTVKDRS